MALSFCSTNWPSYSNSLHQNLNVPDTVVFPQIKKPRSSSALSFPNTYSFNNVDPLVLQTNITHRNNSSFSNPTNDNTNFISALSPQSLFPLEYSDQDYHNYNNYNLDYNSGFYGNINHYYSDNYPEFFFNNGAYSPNYTGLIPENENYDIDQLLLAPLIAKPHDENVMSYGYNYKQEMVTTNDNTSSDELKKTTASSTTVAVSPQSIAARERRRKITEKTQELGKLIPGGTKMSTAEMFQAASKYVKFLQAQVAVLKEMKEEPLLIKELRVLASPIIQEKLYSEEKCLVPKQLVDRTGGSND
ncbi:Basic helix-loop-helix transcription factor [Trema orientale]|uniref:Basic helix-loop-helix transcription factor n=1 Tax=Trema orientale TaxID=63057 RepID=A0A2P5FZS2_TREOI|nr:Basic helix-loop-helix transcription factor [Trema orientale]